LTALAWLGMYNWAYLWLHVDGPLSAHDVAQGFAEIFLRGIARAARDSP
jgi:Tetracyclin repressor-like, C-terminal domain